MHTADKLRAAVDGKAYPLNEWVSTPVAGQDDELVAKLNEEVVKELDTLWMHRVICVTPSRVHFQCDCHLYQRFVLFFCFKQLGIQGWMTAQLCPPATLLS